MQQVEAHSLLNPAERKELIEMAVASGAQEGDVILLAKEFAEFIVGDIQLFMSARPALPQIQGH